MCILESESINISLLPTEFELDKFPSFRAKINVVFLHPTGTLTYQSGSVWFGIDDWDSFSNDLDSMQNRTKVSDLSYDVEFEIARSDLRTVVNISLRRRIAGFGEAQLNINLEEGSELLEKFRILAKSVRHRYLSAQSEKG